MYIVEVGLVSKKETIADVSFHKRSESMDDNEMKRQIFGIYGMVSETFTGTPEKTEIDKYSILFLGVDLGKEDGDDHDDGKGTIVLDNLYLIYVLVDNEKGELDPIAEKTIKEKMHDIASIFKYEVKARDGDIFNKEFRAYFSNKIDATFKDLLKTPNERFNELFGK
ncbi:MAG: hypothetical protein ACTSVI_11645 [Promethearchaeota archaeon]